HDLSEGGLAVAAAEMAFAGEVGADLTEVANVDAASDSARLFSESATRWLVEVEPQHSQALEELFADLPMVRIGHTVAEPRLRIAGANGEWLVWAALADLMAAWQSLAG